MDPIANRREFTRVQVNLLAELRSGGSVDIAGTLVDVSLNGMFVTCAANLPVNTMCEISLQLDAGGEMMTIKTEGKVIRQDSAGLGLQFTKILGPDSLAHLQNLVLYNSGDQIAQVEKELSGHVGLKPSGSPA